MRTAARRSGPLRVLVCADEGLMRLGLRCILTPEEGFDVVGEVVAGADLAELVDRTDVDAVVVDVDHGVRGHQSLERLVRRHASVPCVALSCAEDVEAVAAAFRSGAKAYVLKSIDPRDLPSAIRQAVHGCVFQLGALMPDSQPAAIRTAGLSAKEAKVLAELAKGASNRSIAATLWLSEQTVKFHLRNIYRKLGVANRTEALGVALDRHLVDAA